VLLLGLVAGTTAFIAARHTVTLDVDGSSRTVHTYAHTVADVLAEQGVVVEPRDQVSPAPTASVRDGLVVSVVNARPVVLLVDGQRRTLWTTAQTVAELAAQLGGRYTAAYLSASRSTRIPLAGTTLGVRLPKAVTINADGRAVQVVTTAATWGDTLTEAGISLASTDLVSIPLVQSPTDGDVQTVTRQRYQTKVSLLPIAFATVQRADSTRYQGTTAVAQVGKPGVRQQTWQLFFKNGALASQRLVSDRVVTAPVDQIVLVGTKPRPVTTFVARRTSVDGLNWSALAYCESGGNPRAVGGGGTYFGLYQFTLGTWARLGGTGNPIDHSAAEQTYRAKLLYQRSGASPWPTCGHLLYS
jgi:uncharacterized protein YabE (DUF348 family)